MTKSYSLPKLDVGTLKQAILGLAKEAGIEPSNLRISASYDVSNIGTETRYLSLDDLSTIVSFEGSPRSLSVRFRNLNVLGLSDDLYLMLFRQYGDTFNVNYFFDKHSFAEIVPSFVEKTLSLEPPPPKEEQSKAPEPICTEGADHKPVSGDRPLKCFISYRFDKATEPYVMELQKFLSLINVISTSGRPYQPRNINEKVEDILRADIDFCIYLISESGESAWIRDEAVYSRAIGTPVFPLVEECVTLQPGLLGSSEYIKFPKDHISATFIPLLEGINYIRYRT